MQEMNLDSYLTLYMEVNLSKSTDTNIRLKIATLLKENKEEKLHDVGFHNDRLDMTPM